MSDNHSDHHAPAGIAKLNPVELRSLIKQRLQAFEVQQLSAPKSAAVALIIVESGYGADVPGLANHRTWQTDPALILTRRAASLSKHAGQWALPGGRIDGNETVAQTAQRESEEEIGLTLSEDDCLGRLDDYVSRSGFVMSPLVYWPHSTDKMQANPQEVASIHRIPCAEFLRAEAPLLDYDELQESERQSAGKHPVLRMPLGDHWIAAPTAAILYQFREVCLLGQHTRVAHFEQPKFSWR